MATTITGSDVTTGSVTASGDVVATGELNGSNILVDPTFSRVEICNFPNTTAYPNGSSYSFTLTEQQAPIGSYVIMQMNIFSGNSSGDQYAYLTQNTAGNYGRIGQGIEGWYWYSLNQGLFRINTPEDRAFTMDHATIVATNVNDARVVYYCGYIMDN